MHRTIALLSFGIALYTCAQHTRVLFIGNSYTYVNDLPNTFRQLALSMGDTVDVAMSAPGGYTFEQHAVYAPTLAAIAAGPWDFVVLQEQSQRPSFPPEQVAVEVLPFAAQLVDTIRTRNACTRPVFYMTWGRRDGDASNCAAWPPVCTYAGMQAQLRASYVEMALDNDAACAPVGMAWSRTRADLPDLELYVSDGSHPTVAGTYLAANVLYATLFRHHTEDATYTDALNADTAAMLRTIAATTVLDSLDTWNVLVNDPDADFTWTVEQDGWVQFHHAGTGEHTWLFSDGSTAVGGDPHPHFLLGQELHVLHIYTDACGRVDTAEATIPLFVVGIDPVERVQAQVLAAPGGVWVSDAPANARFMLYDTMGRLVKQVAAGPGRAVVMAPPGAYVWCITSANGPVQRGKVAVR